MKPLKIPILFLLVFLAISPLLGILNLATATFSGTEINEGFESANWYTDEDWNAQGGTLTRVTQVYDLAPNYYPPHSGSYAMSYSAGVNYATQTVSPASSALIVTVWVWIQQNEYGYFFASDSTNHAPEMALWTVGQTLYIGYYDGPTIHDSIAIKSGFEQRAWQNMTMSLTSSEMKVWQNGTLLTTVTGVFGDFNSVSFGCTGGFGLGTVTGTVFIDDFKIKTGTPPGPYATQIQWLASSYGTYTINGTLATPQTVQYNSTDLLILNATANPGYAFVSWTVPGSTPTDNPYIFSPVTNGSAYPNFGELFEPITDGFENGINTSWTDVRDPISPIVTTDQFWAGTHSAYMGDTSSYTGLRYPVGLPTQTTLYIGGKFYFTSFVDGTRLMGFIVGQYDLGIWVDSGGSLESNHLSIGESSWVSSGQIATLSIDTWYDITCRYTTGSNYTIWLNNVKIYTESNVGTMPYSLGFGWLGNYNAGPGEGLASVFNYYLDNAAISNTQPFKDAPGPLPPDTYLNMQSVIPVGSGTTTPTSPSGPTAYNDTDIITLTATPTSTNYTFWKWTISDHADVADNPYNLTMSQNYTVTAIFNSTLIHDIAVTQVVPSPGSGYSPDYAFPYWMSLGPIYPPPGRTLIPYKINVTIRNEGDLNETFDVTAYAIRGAYTLTVGTQTVVNLTAGEERNVTFTWDLTNLPASTSLEDIIYTLSVNITEPSVSSMVAGQVKILFPGNTNGDNQVSITDVGPLVYAWGSKVGDANWDPRCDYNRDGEINTWDVSVIIFEWYAMP